MRCSRDKKGLRNVEGKLFFYLWSFWQHRWNLSGACRWDPEKNWQKLVKGENFIWISSLGSRPTVAPTTEEGKVSLCLVNLVLGYPLVIDPFSLGTDIDFLFALCCILRTGLAFCCLGQPSLLSVFASAGSSTIIRGPWKYDRNVGHTHFQLASTSCWKPSFFCLSWACFWILAGPLFCTFLGDASCTHGKVTKGILALVSSHFVE